jgi:hypothetical protein
MSEYIAWQPEDSIGPSFNEAAQKLTAISNVTITETVKASMQPYFSIDTTDSGAEEVRRALPGWKVFPLQAHSN